MSKRKTASDVAAEPLEVSGPFGSAWHAMGDSGADDMVAKGRLVSALDDAIKAAGLKQGEAAERLGMPQSNLSRLLSGRFRSVTFDQLFKLLAAMGVDVRVTIAPAIAGASAGVAVTVDAHATLGGANQGAAVESGGR